ncbi:hypothetical protein AMTR_s00024p00138600 [Amborella trichopoda]|uniref:Peptidase S8/S53 domain-containing protein n=1 Tax=Amborella trichopoda TaxID=13333 RepID=W1PTQ1_AMBTC|nr:hypothetical protein AMTR_s00024p00138600 [Amborella trichopoda]
MHSYVYAKAFTKYICVPGVWPESLSFDDRGIGPIPLRWKGFCESGRQFNASHCSRKLIEGHGAHTFSIAAGSPVASATFGRFAIGVARGGVPLARLAVYKASWMKGGMQTY